MRARPGGSRLSHPMDEPLRSTEPRVDARGVRPPPAFHTDELLVDDGTLVLRLVGEFDLAASDGFRERVASALAAGSRNILLDMEETRFIDSSMLKELLRASAAAADAGGRLVLTGVGPAVGRLFELTRVTELLTLASSRDDGLARLSGRAAGV
jgi:anti-anti-sigma factor